MNEPKLFLASDGNWITPSVLLRALEAVQAGACEVLYLHTGLTFGQPNPELGRQGLLESLHGLLAQMGIPSLCLPAFTFSFCNGEAFQVQTSRCRMGALNEYFRAQPGTVRSVDPLMSNLLVGVDRDLVTGLGKDSAGSGSTFHQLHLRGPKVRFLFFGVTASDCFTYTHYVEEMLSVPYRYQRSFHGCITDGERTWEDDFRLFVRYHGVVPATDGKLERSLRDQGHLRLVPCGDSSISCVDEPSAYATITAQIEADTHAYIALDPKDGDRTFQAKRMVAL